MRATRHSHCTDLGGGYCVDKLRAGEWLKYTVDVRVGQTYAVEARVAGISSSVRSPVLAIQRSN